MYIYRPHRSTLSESIVEAKEFKTKEEMFKYIVGCYSRKGEMPPFGIYDLVIDERKINDERIGWRDTRNVCVRRFYNEMYYIPQCIGMCATKYRKVRSIRYAV